MVQPSLRPTEVLPDRPLVSVILSNFNYGRFLAQAIESVLRQSYPCVELIVVDDGSTDDSRAVIQSYEGRLTAIFQQNSGQPAAFNQGLAQAQGEVICFLDADDYFHPEKVAKVVSAFQEHRSWVQVSHGWLTIDQEGRTLGRNSSRRFSRGEVRDLLLTWGRYAVGITSGLSYRRSVLTQVMPLPAQPKAADTYLTATVPFYGEVGAIDEPLMYYRMHGNNRRAHSDNLPYIIQQREDTCSCINRAARQTQLSQRFDLNQDADYRGFRAIQTGGITWGAALGVIGLSLRESFAIGRSPLDTLNRLVQRGGCVLLSPNEARALLRLGARGYMRTCFGGKA